LICSFVIQTSSRGALHLQLLKADGKQKSSSVNQMSF